MKSSWLVNVTWSIPTLLLVFAITMAMGGVSGRYSLPLADHVGEYARLVRGQVMSIKEMEYIQAARDLGLRNSRIIVRHILPNILGPVLVLSPPVILPQPSSEAGLSFLGIGATPATQLGTDDQENYNFIITHNPMLALIPGFAIMLLVLAFNLLGTD